MFPENDSGGRRLGFLGEEGGDGANGVLGGPSLSQTVALLDVHLVQLGALRVPQKSLPEPHRLKKRNRALNRNTTWAVKQKRQHSGTKRLKKTNPDPMDSSLRRIGKKLIGLKTPRLGEGCSRMECASGFG